MNWRRIPLIPTLLVIAAAGYMVHLGLWQLDRLAQKEAMIASFSAAQADQTVHPWPRQPMDHTPTTPYSRVRFTCHKLFPAFDYAEAGRNAQGEAGWAHAFFCKFDEKRAPVMVVVGWSQRPDGASWQGGEVVGTYLSREHFKVVVADPPLAGLQANAKPDPRDLPNNHLSYAVQWFAFALTALVIYGLALRKRLKAL